MINCCGRETEIENIERKTTKNSKQLTIKCLNEIVVEDYQKNKKIT